MNALTERILAEHVSRFFDCSCGHNITPPRDGSGFATHADMYARHVAEVTEAAVRAQVAADIEAREFTREVVRDLVRFGGSVEWSEGHDDAVHLAARIARGEVTS